MNGKMTNSTDKAPTPLQMATKIVGEFKDDKLDGYAVQYSSDGSILKEGIWKDDEFQYAQANSSATVPEVEISSSKMHCLPVRI